MLCEQGNEMNDKEKLDFLEHYVTDLLNNRIDLNLRKGRFGMPWNRFNKVDCAHLEGEIDALNKVREFIKRMQEKRETD